MDAAVSVLAGSQVVVAEKLDRSRKLAAALHDDGVMWVGRDGRDEFSDGLM